MHYVNFDELSLSGLGLGCMGMSEFYGSVDDFESTKTICRAYGLGVNHFDTADVYGAGHNEVLLGKALKHVDRSRITIATKCGFVRNGENNAISGLNCSPEHIKKSCELSLKRLNVDYIDLFYLHRADPVIPIEVSIQALSDLVKEGKVRYIGLSAVGPDTIERAHAIHPLTAVQSEYSILTRDVEIDVLPLCKKLNIGFVAYSPLGNGFLNGKIRSLNQVEDGDVRKVLPRWQDENIEYNLAIVKILEEIADKRGNTPGQIALSWILAQGNKIIAIPGTRRIKHLKENLAAAEIKLSDKELEYLSTNIPYRFAKGDRLPREFSKLLNNYEVNI